MDSGNSGSVQSSSGGSEEFDSRADTISAFFNSNPSSHIGHGPLGVQQPPVMQRQHHQSQPPSSMLFDPYPDHNPNSQLNLDAVWSRNTRSEPNCNDLGGFMAAQQAQSRATFSSVQIPQGPESGTKASVSGTTDQQPNNMVRNSKKRSRASRRAPTTVLTTDTTNFRAMVQEFTGIPAPPFTSSSFPRIRLDLFGTTSTLRSTQLDPSSPHYVLRPFAQKLHYSSMVDAIASTPSTNSTSTTTSINCQLPSELGLLKQLPQNPLNNISMHNPILNSVSLLQTLPKYPLPNSTESPLQMGVFEESVLSQGHGNINLSGGVQNMVPSLPGNHNSANPPSWGASINDQSLLRSISGGYDGNTNTQRVTNGKENNSPVPSSENAATRSEGMVESWMCSSD